MIITSLQNKHIKDLMLLGNRRHRDEAGHTLVEGIREVTRALAAGIVPTEAYVCMPLVTTDEAKNIVDTLRGLNAKRKTHLIEVTPAVFEKIAYRGDSGGVLLRIPYTGKGLDDIPLQKNPLIAVIDGVEKPGNLGAILRTADGAGVTGVVVCSGRTDIHNPNVIRASLGAFFTVPVVEEDSQEAIRWLKQNNIHIIAATPEGAIRYTQADMKGPVAIVTGSEAQGVSPAWLEASDTNVVIPMAGDVDSLNLATATALLLYEAVRQRLWT